MSLNLRQIRMFLAVAQDLHFSRAARRLHVAQPALSRAIRALETELGSALFERNTRKVELTQAGRLFRAESQRAMVHLERAERAVRGVSEGEAGYLRIGYMDFAIEGEFPRILKEFRARSPGVSVEARASFTERILEDLHEGAIDVGFVVGPARRAGLATVAVQNDRFVAVVPENHHLAGKAAVRVSDLADEPLIMGRRETWGPYVRRVEALCESAGFRPKVIQEADTTESLFAFVASGIGSTIYVERAFNYDPPGIRIRDLRDVRTTVPTEVAWRRDDETPVVRNFVALTKGRSQTIFGR